MRRTPFAAAITALAAASQLLAGSALAALDPSCVGVEGATEGTKCLTNPLGTSDPFILLGTSIKLALGLVGSIALVMFVYGGFLMLTSRGDSKLVDKGKGVFKAAIIGLAIIFSSYAIVTQIFKVAGL